MDTTNTKTCKRCRKPFLPKSARRTEQYCSVACRTTSHLRCELCDAYLKKGRTRFCGKSCYDEWQRRDTPMLICKTCKTRFPVHPSNLIYKNNNRPTKQSVRQFCSPKCRYASPEFHELAIQMNQIQQSGKTTSIEKIGYGLLDELGVMYQPQHLISGKMCVDAFVKSANLIIQFDGDYWHGHPDRYTVLDSRQQKRRAYDISQDAYFRTCGYRVLRLWERDLQNRPQACQNLMREAIFDQTHQRSVA